MIKAGQLFEQSGLDHDYKIGFSTNQKLKHCSWEKLIVLIKLNGHPILLYPMYIP